LEQVIAIVFVLVASSAVTTIFLPSLAEAICIKLKVRNWTPLDNDDLLIFILGLPLWLFWGFSKAYWAGFEKVAAGADVTAGLFLLWLAGIAYLTIVVGVLSTILPLDYLLSGKS
jgi:hypothetical protein